MQKLCLVVYPVNLHEHTNSSAPNRLRYHSVLPLDILRGPSSLSIYITCSCILSASLSSQVIARDGNEISPAGGYSGGPTAEQRAVMAAVARRSAQTAQNPSLAAWFECVSFHTHHTETSVPGQSASMINCTLTVLLCHLEALGQRGQLLGRILIRPLFSPS